MKAWFYLLKKLDYENGMWLLNNIFQSRHKYQYMHDTLDKQTGFDMCWNIRIFHFWRNLLLVM